RIPLLRLTVVAALTSAAVALLGSGPSAAAAPALSSGRPPALPGVRIIRASAGTAKGYLTESSARAFGAALQRQYLADRARASYGTDGLLRGVSIALAGPRSPATGPGSPARPDSAARTAFPMYHEFVRVRDGM